MTSPICATLAGSLSGTTRQGSLTPVPLAYVLDAQSGHQQLSGQVEAGETKPITLPTNLGGPIATPNPQTMFILTSDVGSVEVTLNALGTPVGPFLFPKANGVLVLPGQVGASPGVPVSDISIVNAGSQRATVTVTAIYGS